MDYKVYTPASELQAFIKCFWTLEDDRRESPSKQRVVPDGCMELIFHYGDEYLQFFEDGSSVVQPRSFIFGQLTSYIEIAPSGITGIIAARFLPEGLASFLDRPVTKLENKAVSLEELFGDSGIILETAVLAATDNQHRQALIETFLLSRLSTRQVTDAVTKSFVAAIHQSHGQTGIVEMAEKLNLHRRNIERRFTASIGMSPKQLAKVVRLQTTFRMLDEKNFTSLTELAYENGYYDQAHFIKDFKEFTGHSPKEFYAHRFRLATLFAGAE